MSKVNAESCARAFFVTVRQGGDVAEVERLVRSCGADQFRLVRRLKGWRVPDRKIEARLLWAKLGQWVPRDVNLGEVIIPGFDLPGAMVYRVDFPTAPAVGAMKFVKEIMGRYVLRVHASMKHVPAGDDVPEIAAIPVPKAPPHRTPKTQGSKSWIKAEARKAKAR